MDKAMNENLTTFMSLMIGELKLSMRDASGSVNELTRTFMEMVRDVHEIKACAERSLAQKQNSDALREVIAISNKYLDKVQAGTVGFQFYDKMTQRITHVSNSMQAGLNLIADKNSADDTKKWEKLQTDMKNHYNTEQDRELYKNIMDGKSIKEAVELAATRRAEQENNVELF